MKEFPQQVKCDDDMIRESGGSETLLKALWNRFQSLRTEFIDYDCFVSFAKSLTDGRSAVCTPGSVVSSGISGSRSSLAN